METQTTEEYDEIRDRFIQKFYNLEDAANGSQIYKICTLIMLGLLFISILFMYATIKIYRKLDNYDSKFYPSPCSSLVSSLFGIGIVTMAFAIAFAVLLLPLLFYAGSDQNMFGRNRDSSQESSIYYKRKPLIFKDDVEYVYKAYKRSRKLQNFYLGSAIVSCVLTITFLMAGIALYVYNPFKRTLGNLTHFTVMHIHQSDVTQAVLHNAQIPYFFIGLAVIFMLIMLTSMFSDRRQITSRAQFDCAFEDLKEYVIPPTYQEAQELPSLPATIQQNVNTLEAVDETNNTDQVEPQVEVQREHTINTPTPPSHEETMESENISTGSSTTIQQNVNALEAADETTNTDQTESQAEVQERHLTDTLPPSYQEITGSGNTLESAKLFCVNLASMFNPPHMRTP